MTTPRGSLDSWLDRILIGSVGLIIIWFGGKGSLCLKDAMVEVFRINIPGDEQLGPLVKYDLGKLGAKILAEGDLTADEMATAKDRVGKGYLNPAIVMAVWDALDATPKEG